MKTAYYNPTELAVAFKHMKPTKPSKSCCGKPMLLVRNRLICKTCKRFEFI